MPYHGKVDQNEPWQRNPWVWLIIAIPSLTVAGCLVTIYLALSRPDYLVSDRADVAVEAEQASRAAGG
jgi:hypothetical protein